MQSYYAKLLCKVIMQSYYAKLLCSYCAKLLCKVIMQSYCAKLLCKVIMQSYCAKLLCKVIVQSYCAKLLCKDIMQSYYAKLLCKFSYTLGSLFLQSPSPTLDAPRKQVKIVPVRNKADVLRVSLLFVIWKTIWCAERRPGSPQLTAGAANHSTSFSVCSCKAESIASQLSSAHTALWSIQQHTTCPRGRHCIAVSFIHFR